MRLNTKRRRKKAGIAVLCLFLLLNIVCITQAYHLTHFYEHGTVKPLADQTRTTWGLVQVAFTGLKQEKLVGTLPDSSYSTVKLKTADGLLLDAWSIPVAQPKGTVILFHGHGSEKSANLSQSDVFNSLGYATLLVDFRAHGQSSGNTCTIGYREAQDVKAAYDYVARTGEKHIILYGISLGAATVTKAVSDYGLTPDKIILEMPFASLPATVEGKMKLAGLPAEPLAGLLTFWGGTINGFWAFGMQPKKFVKAIRCPVLLQWGRQDKGVREGEINEIFQNISAPKQLVVYEESGHENLCENEPDKWEAMVEAFLASGQ